MTHSFNTLLIDDDIEFCELLTEYLSSQGFAVTVANDGAAGVQQALAHNFDIIILDVMLPKMNGFDVLKKIKPQISTPVLMFTAKGEEIDQLIGLEIGADDYLAKPCSPRLLVARLKAILRRINESDSNDQADANGVTNNTTKKSVILVADNIQIDHDRRLVLLDQQALELTNSEYNILCCLVKNKNKVVTKETLCEQGLKRKIESFDRSVDMHISHVRNKIGKKPDGSPKIKTVRGIGYILETELP